MSISLQDSDTQVAVGVHRGEQPCSQVRSTWPRKVISLLSLRGVTDNPRPSHFLRALTACSCIFFLAFGASYLLLGAPLLVAHLFGQFILIILSGSAVVCSNRGTVANQTLSILPLSALFVLLISALGVVGILLSSLILLLHTILNIEPVDPALLEEQALSFGDPMAADDYSHGLTETAVVYPLVEVMKSGTPSEKQRALAVILRTYQSSFAEPLHLALKDSSNAIRVGAASVLTTLVDRYRKKILQLETALQTEAGLRPSESIDSMLALGLACAEFATSGLLDSSSSQHMGDKAVSVLTQCLAVDPTLEEAVLQVGSLLLKGGRTDEALQWYQQAIETSVSSETLWLSYMQALYVARSFDRLDQAIQRYASRFGMSEHTLPNLTYWSAHNVTDTSTVGKITSITASSTKDEPLGERSRRLQTSRAA